MITEDVGELALDDEAAETERRPARKRRKVKRHAWRRAVLRKRGGAYFLKVYKHRQRRRLAGRRILIDDVGAMMTARMAKVDRAARRIFLLSATRKGSDGAGAAVDGGKPLHDLPALDRFPKLSARHI